MHKRPSNLVAIGLVAAANLLLTGCGVVQTTVEGITAGPNTPNPPPDSHKSANPDTNDALDPIIVEVTIDSDAPTASDINIEVSGKKYSESVREDTVSLPYVQTFKVPTGTWFPLESTLVEATAANDAQQVTCKIEYNGEVVMTHTAKGKAAKSVCDKQFEWGPG